MSSCFLAFPFCCERMVLKKGITGVIGGYGWTISTVTSSHVDIESSSTNLPFSSCYCFKIQVIYYMCSKLHACKLYLPASALGFHLKGSRKHSIAQSRIMAQFRNKLLIQYNLIKLYTQKGIFVFAYLWYICTLFLLKTILCILGTYIQFQFFHYLDTVLTESC